MLPSSRLVGARRVPPGIALLALSFLACAQANEVPPADNLPQDQGGAGNGGTEQSGGQAPGGAGGQAGQSGGSGGSMAGTGAAGAGGDGGTAGGGANQGGAGAGGNEAGSSGSATGGAAGDGAAGDGGAGAGGAAGEGGQAGIGGEPGGAGGSSGSSGGGAAGQGGTGGLAGQTGAGGAAGAGAGGEAGVGGVAQGGAAGSAGNGGAAGGAGGGAGGGCAQAGVVAEIAWEAFSGSLVRSSDSTWQVGKLAAAAGAFPAGAVVLGTRPAQGSYGSGLEEWVELPALDLAGYKGCKVTLSFELFRDTEGTTGRRDGGNLQVTTDAGAGPGASWAVLDGPEAGYDGPLTEASCGGGCWLAGQPVWSGRPAASRSVQVPLDAFVGAPSVTVRFTFHSDGVIQYRGLLLGNLVISAG